MSRKSKMNNEKENIYQTSKGYFYKITKTGHKIRVSEKEFKRFYELPEKDKISKLNINIQNQCAFDFMKNIEEESVQLILTDPPYGISKNNGMEKLYQRSKLNSFEKHPKYGKKYATQKNFGSWDENFELRDLQPIIVFFF